MEFITGEQFLKEDKEVQEVVDNSIKLCIGDRIYHKLSKKYYIYLGEYNEVFWNVFDLEDKCKRVVCKDYFCRCLCEGQLRKFIEDKSSDFDSESEAVIEIEFYTKEDLEDKVTQKEIGYLIKILDKSDGLLIDCCCDLGTDLLQAYWKVAVQIAKNIDN